MSAWAKGFYIAKSYVDAALLEELLSHGYHYAHFLSRSSLRAMLKSYLEKRSIEKTTWISYLMLLLMHITVKLFCINTEINQS